MAPQISCLFNLGFRPGVQKIPVKKKSFSIRFSTVSIHHEEAKMEEKLLLVKKYLIQFVINYQMNFQIGNFVTKQD